MEKVCTHRYCLFNSAGSVTLSIYCDGFAFRLLSSFMAATNTEMSLKQRTTYSGVQGLNRGLLHIYVVALELSPSPHSVNAQR